MINSPQRAFARLALATAAIAVIVVAAAPSSVAAGGYTVKAGTTTTGTTTYTGKAGTVTLTDLSVNNSISCASATIGGTVKLGANRPGLQLLPISKSTWVGCNVLGNVFDGNVTGKTYFNGQGATTATGRTAGTISPVGFGFASLLCSFTLSGAIDAGFTNAAPTLTMKSVATSANKLTLTGVSGCLGLVHNGDLITFSATYKIKTPLGKLSITG